MRSLEIHAMKNREDSGRDWRPSDIQIIPKLFDSDGATTVHYD